MSEKACSKCGVTKPLDEFHRSSRAKDGRKPMCKACTKEQAAAYYRKPGVAERQKETHKRRKTSAAHRARVKAMQENPPDVEKVCTACEVSKPLDEFYRSQAGKYGRESRCKDCAKAAYRSRSKEYESRPERQANAYARNRRRQYAKYGITPEGYNAFFEQQSGRCAICGTDKPGGKGRKRNLFAVDHDHDTGKVRALLCSECNVGIGLFRDDPDLLLRAIGYLAKHGIAEVASS